MVTALLTAAIAVVALSLYKLCVVVKHVRWIHRRGADYGARLVGLRTYRQYLTAAGSPPAALTDADIHAELMDPALNGDAVALLGFKEFKGRARAEGLRHATNRGARLAGRALTAAIWVFDFVRVGLVSGIVVLLAGVLLPDTGQEGLLRWTGAAVCLVLELTVLVICAEATVNFASMGSYALAHHDPIRFVDDPQPSRFIAELNTLVGLALAAVFIDAVTLSFIGNAQLATFADHDLLGWDGVLASLYHAAMTFIFSTQLEPSSPLAMLYVLVVSLQGIAVLVVAVAAWSGATPVNK